MVRVTFCTANEVSGGKYKINLDKTYVLQPNWQVRSQCHLVTSTKIYQAVTKLTPITSNLRDLILESETISLLYISTILPLTSFTNLVTIPKLSFASRKVTLCKIPMLLFSSRLLRSRFFFPLITRWSLLSRRSMS